MAFEVRGVMEGFYGRPWSWAERASMIEFIADLGFNFFMFAPKNDPIHRNRWREPYLPEEIARFERLNRLAESRGVEFNFGLSPLEFHYTDPEFLRSALEKYRALQAVGVQSFCVLLDDMPERFRYADDGERFATLAEAQAWLNNEVLRELRASGPVKRVLFCPTEYHGAGVSKYLSELGERMDPAIDIYWTGRQVCSTVLRTEDARAVSETLRRPIVYWDNYPVNDGDMRFRAHIRPLLGRDADLDRGCKGLVVNPGPLAEAPKIPIHTVGAYLADPSGYEPETAWQDALLAVTGNAEDARAVAILGDLTRHSDLEPQGRVQGDARQALERFWAARGGAPESAGPDLPGYELGATGEAAPATAASREQADADLRATLANYAWAANRILHDLENRRLAADLQPWAEKLLGWTRVASNALALLNLAEQAPGDDRLPALREAIVDDLAFVRENFMVVAGDFLDQFARRCLWAAEAR
ncbi:MAG TPA: protein O-GlcNAcase [Deinococcales bacterium]|nr:protein O-GlcNAcase [Deinococcales bacterium]